MLDLAFELMGQATSNSLLMFCFCNLIIVMILRGSKPGSIVEQEIGFCASLACNMCKSDSEEMITVNVDTPSSSEKDELMSIGVSTVSEKFEETVEEDEESRSCSDDDDDNDDMDEEEEEHEVEEEEEDDDLRKRVEEFIAKVNEEWKKEKLRALNLAIQY